MRSQVILASILTPEEWEGATPGTENAAVTAALTAVHKAKLIYDRFDALMDLIAAYDKYIEANPADNIWQEFRASAITFASAIVNAKNEEELKEKAELRRKYKKIDPTYMPWPVPAVTKVNFDKFESYPTDKAARKAYVKTINARNLKLFGQKRLRLVDKKKADSDKEKNVKRPTPEERENYRIFINQGKLSKIIVNQHDGNLILTDFVTTADYNAHGTSKSAIFIVSSDGGMFAGSTQQDVFHHSSLGKASLFAGVISAREGGKVTGLSGHSGHFLPGPQNVVPFLMFFRENNLLDFNFLNQMMMFIDEAKELVEFVEEAKDVVETDENKKSLQYTAPIHDSPNYLEEFVRAKRLNTSAAQPYIDKFTKQEDKDAYIANVRQLSVQTDDECKKAYAQTAITLLETHVKNYVSKINNKLTRDTLKENFDKLASAFIISNIDLSATFDDLSSSIFSILNEIQTNAEFIKKLAIKCNYSAKDANAIAMGFVDQVVKSIIIANSITKDSVESAISDTKLMMRIDLHAITYEKNNKDLSEKVLVDFRNTAKFFVQNLSEKAKVNFRDDMIVAAFNHAKYVIEYRVQLIERLFAESSKLKSFAKQEDCLVQKDVEELIKIIMDVVNEIDQATSLDVLQEVDEKSFELINEKKQFLAAKNELACMLAIEMSYMSKKSKKQTEGLVLSLEVTKNIEEVKKVAIAISETSVVTKNHGTFGALSLFENPIKKKLESFIKKCTNKKQVTNYNRPS